VYAKPYFMVLNAASVFTYYCVSAENTINPYFISIVGLNSYF